MLIDKHQPEDVFARVPELAAQIDPVLHTLDILLEDNDLYQQVRADLGKRYRFTLVHGRHSTPVEVLLRMLLCKHLYQWSFKETEERVKDSLVLRWFCRVYFARVPDEYHLNNAGREKRSSGGMHGVVRDRERDQQERTLILAG